MSGIFQKTSVDIIQHMQKRIASSQITFLFPTSYMSPQSVQVGYLLNRLYNHKRKKQLQENYKNFFANSRMEALHGAIKIARHKALVLNPKAKGEVIVLTQDKMLKNYFNPLTMEKGCELIPGVTFVSDYSEAIQEIKIHPYAALVFRRAPDSSLEEIHKIFRICKPHKIITVLDEADLDYKQAGLYAKDTEADIYVLGESLTNHQVPFAVFSMSDSIYQPWNTIKDCLSHSSTYSGNCLALSTVLNVLNELFTLSDADTKVLKKMAENNKYRIKSYAKYINPKAAFLYHLAGYDFKVASAKGARLITDAGKSLLDFSGGGGCNLHGHNPPDIIDNVLNLHDKEKNYWEALAKKLQTLTGLAKVFPGISGASVVEIAMIMGLLAQFPKKKILTFKGNYAGKTLIALNATQQEGVREPFFPLYSEVLVIDPFREGAEDAVTSALTSGEIALVWFESLSHAEPLPPTILQLINQHKQAGAYLIGVDEVLMGVFRTGTFLHCENIIDSPDLVTLSKNLSDMTFPIAAALVSDNVYQMAHTKNPVLVDYLEGLYVNQLGSHIALHGLQKSHAVDTVAHVNKMGQQLRAGLDKVVRETSFLKKTHGKGLFQALEVDESVPAVKLVGKDLMKIFLSHEYYKRSQGVSFFFSHIPPLNINESEIAEIVECSNKALYRRNAWTIVIAGVCNIIKNLSLLFSK